MNESTKAELRQMDQQIESLEDEVYQLENSIRELQTAWNYQKKRADNWRDKYEAIIKL